MPRDEAARYAAVNDQITSLLDAMANDRDPLAFVANIGRAWLAAEMYDRNEKSHMAHEARVGIIQALEHRIQLMQQRTNWRDEVRKWHDEEELAIAYIKHGAVSIPPKRQQEGS